MTSRDRHHLQQNIWRVAANDGRTVAREARAIA
jgi:hypothetical protein